MCGILTEAVTDFETGDIEFAVIGIGLNLKLPKGGFPEEIQEKAGAVLTEAKSVDRNRLAAAIVNELLKETEKKGIPQEYIRRNMVPGRTICIVQEVETGGKAKEILPDGRLRICNEQGQERTPVRGRCHLLHFKAMFSSFFCGVKVPVDRKSVLK